MSHEKIPNLFDYLHALLSFTTRYLDQLLYLLYRNFWASSSFGPNQALWYKFVIRIVRIIPVSVVPAIINQ